jgi:hypothetical protein
MSKMPCEAFKPQENPLEVHPKRVIQARETLNSRGLVSCFMTNSLESLKPRIAQASQKRVLQLEFVQGGGYSLALRLRAFFEDGTTAFVKVATSQDLARFLRTEHHVYSSLSSQVFMPEFLGWNDDGAFPLLMLEDLGAAFCVPPWTTARIDGVLSALEVIHSTTPPANIGVLETPETRDHLNGWKDVARDPDSFLGAGFCSRDWLEQALSALIEAETKIELIGNDFIHLDVRSDNIGFKSEARAVLVDWNWVRVGNGEIDLAFWLPSLHAEGGPKLETFLPNAAPWAASVSGFFASGVGLPAPAAAPKVRIVQRLQLGTALPWAARALGLPKPDGQAPELILV